MRTHVYCPNCNISNLVYCVECGHAYYMSNEVTCTHPPVHEENVGRTLVCACCGWVAVDTGVVNPDTGEILAYVGVRN